MNYHELKIHPEHYNNVKAGTKTFEIRKNDRAFQKGDTVKLFWFDPKTQQRNHSAFPDLYFGIGDVYPIDADTVVFSLLVKP